MNNNIEIVEIIMQQRIANFIKENRNMDKKKLIETVEIIQQLCMWQDNLALEKLH